MAYSASILTRAEARLKQAQRAHQQDQARRRAEIYRALPRTAEIDRQLRQTAPRILAAALRQGLGQEEALATLRRENLALQDEEAALLDQAGYPPDALEETPYCPLCNDRGWRGAAMCDCLKDLCRQEQIAELSSLLDLGDQSFDTFRLDYYDRQTWPEFHRSPRENMEFILSSCRSYAENFDAYPHKNLFFNGPPAWERPSSRPALPGWCRNRGMPWFTTLRPTSSPGLKPGNLPGMGRKAARRRQTPAGISPVTC